MITVEARDDEVAIITDDRYEFGERIKVAIHVDVDSAIRIRDEFTAAIEQARAPKSRIIVLSEGVSEEDLAAHPIHHCQRSPISCRKATE